MFKRIAVAAALAGLIAGLLLTAVQQIQVTPLIRAAEALEIAHDAAPPALFATGVANIVLATGFALLLASALALRPPVSWRGGLLWGVAGYLAFFALPSLGLPPELPGTESAALLDRQLWWVGTVASSAAGLWLLAFPPKPAWRALGVVLLVAPHALGAPQPHEHGGTAPADLARSFVVATCLANAVLWLAIGGLVGFFLAESRVTRS